MSLDGNTLGLLMKSNIDNLSDEAKQDREELFKALGAAVVTHITTSAVVSSTVSVVSVSGVTTGGGVSGPGTGTATGTIS